jgi:hypothetical protein
LLAVEVPLMELGDNISREELEIVVKVLVLQMQKLGILFSVVMTELVRSGALTQETFLEILSHSRKSPISAELKDALSKLQDLKAIQDLLRKFEGPLQ